MQRGDLLMARREHKAALREYAKAVELTRYSRREQQIAAHLRLGHVNRALGNMLQCVHAYRRALDLNPEHVGTLKALVSLHAEHREWAFVSKLEDQMLDALEGHPELHKELHKELLQSGDRWWRTVGDERAAARRYKRALDSFPGSAQAEARLRAISSRDVDPLQHLKRKATNAQTPADRARAYLELGRAHWCNRSQRRQAVSCFDAAQRADPTLIEAVEMLIEGLAELGEMERLDELWLSLATADGPHITAARKALRRVIGRPPHARCHGEPSSEARRRETAPQSSRGIARQVKTSAVRRIKRTLPWAKRVG